jgi:DNA-binding transcriptional ArsR family regulator
MASDDLSQTFFALADPTRRAILARLATGEATVSELAAPYEITLAAVSKHLRVLEGAGLISQGRQAQWRPCRLEPAKLRSAYDWISNYAVFWSDSLDALEDYLKLMQGKTDGNA